MINQTNKLPYVDMLRGIAILMVVLVHTSQIVPNLSSEASMIAQYGQMGVQLFFVASAYTLCLSYSKNINQPLKLTAFYIRRFFRIAPLYYIGIALYFTLAVAKELHKSDAIISLEPYSLVNVLANAIFVHGLVPQANNTVVPGGWSIGTEMLFYLLFPVIFSISKRMTERFGFVSVIWIIIASVILNIVVQVFISLEFGIVIKNNEFLYFNIVNQLPVFIIGIAAFYAGRGLIVQEISKPHLVASFYAFGFLILSAAAIFIWFNIDSGYRFAVIPVISGLSFYCLLFYLKISGWTSKILERVGQLSYSIYIFHFIPAWYLVPRIFSYIEYEADSNSHLFISFLFSTTLSLLIASVTEKYVEVKGIKAGSRIIKFLRND